MTLGKDNLVDNNIFYKCLKGITHHAWGEAEYLKLLYSDLMQKYIYEEVDISSDVYLSKYPELAHLLENVEVNTSRNNLIIDCTTPFEGQFHRLLRISNTPIMNDIASDPTFCLDRKIEKYHLQPFPIEDIGLKHNRWVALYPDLYDPVETSEFLKLRMHCNMAYFDNDTDDEMPYDNYFPSGIMDNPLQSNINLYPSPFTRELHLTNAEGCVLQVISVTGVVMHTRKIVRADEVLALGSIPSGIYLFRFEKDGKVKAVKGVKR
jgi:hypothetical protein